MEKVELKIGKTYYIWRFNFISGNPDYVGMFYYVGKKMFCRELGSPLAGMVMHPVMADITGNKSGFDVLHVSGVSKEVRTVCAALSCEEFLVVKVEVEHLALQG